MKKKNIKGTDSVVLTLAMTAAEARLLRNEFYMILSDSDDIETEDDWRYAVQVSFEQWLSGRQRHKYQEKLRPAAEKLYKALRISLRQSPEIPTLNGMWTHREEKKFDKSLEELAKDWLIDKFDDFTDIFPIESAQGRGNALFSSLMKSIQTTLPVRSKGNDDEFKLGIAGKGGSVTWFDSFSEFIERAAKLTAASYPYD